MNSDAARLKNYLRAFERELYRQKKGFAQAKELNESIEQGLDAFFNAVSLLGKPGLDKAFEKEVKEKQLLQLFLEVKKTHGSLLDSLAGKKPALEEVKTKLEKSREYQHYKFPSREAAWEFIEGLLEHYSIPSVFFRHEIIGLAEQWIEKNSVKESGSGIEVKSAKLGELSSSLEKKGIRNGFFLESPFFKAFWKAPNQIQVKADNKTIREIDSFYLLKTKTP